MERQARNTTSSLEDLELKYNVAIERGVMVEEEIKSGEQEREALRIETQRLRDELSDLRIEAEIRQDKLRKAEAIIQRQHRRKPSPIVPELARPQSGLSQLSPTTSNSSPTVATPPTKSASSTVSETPTPPSPPASEKSNPGSNNLLSLLPKSEFSTADANTTPRPVNVSTRPLRHSRGPSASMYSERTPYLPRRTTLSRPEATPRKQGLVQSGSLHHLHGLMNKMQLLEQRVHSVRSKLPAPTSTPPGASPRSGSALSQASIPATVTVRSNKKRIGGSITSSEHMPTERPSSHLSTAYIGGERPGNRTSFSIAQASPNREMTPNRPSNCDAQDQRSVSRDLQGSRPNSRTSLSSRQSISRLSKGPISISSRPGSRQSTSEAQTPVTQYPESRRPRSSAGGYYTDMQSGQSYSANLNRLSTHGSRLQNTDEEESNEVLTPTPSRRSTFAKTEIVTGIPATSASKARLSGIGSGRRISFGAGEMGPPERKPTRKLSEVGESY